LVGTGKAGNLVMITQGFAISDKDEPDREAGQAL
jgi:hypothetical protein